VRLDRRLERLEARVVEAGCPACRDRRSKAVFIEEEGDEIPAPCARCGKVPELIIEITEVAPEDYPDGPPPELFRD
jgi:hypothetical protein